MLVHCALLTSDNKYNFRSEQIIWSNLEFILRFLTLQTIDLGKSEHSLRLCGEIFWISRRDVYLFLWRKIQGAENLSKMFEKQVGYYWDIVIYNYLNIFVTYLCLAFWKPKTILLNAVKYLCFPLDWSKWVWCKNMNFQIFIFIIV